MSDTRNSRVPDIVNELREYGIEPLVHDPVANIRAVQEEYGIALVPRSDLVDLDALVIAVGHQALVQRPLDEILAGLHSDGVVVDIKSRLDRATLPETLTYWAL